MTKEQFRLIAGSNILLASGVFEREELDELEDIFSGHVECGSNVLIAPTYLSDGYEGKEALLARTQQIAAEQAFVAGGILPVPGGIDLMGGDLSYDEYYDEVLEEAMFLSQSGVSLLFLLGFETLLEAKCAVLAAREACDLPICIGLKFDAFTKLKDNTDPVNAVITLQCLGISAAGCAFSSVDAAADSVAVMKDFASVPLFVLPDVDNAVEPQDLSLYAGSFVSHKCVAVGAAHGSNSAYTGALSKELWQLHPFMPDFPQVNAVTAITQIFFMDFHNKVIGENKNLLEISIESEEEVRPVIEKLIASNAPPVCFRITDMDALEFALKLYPGRPAVKSDQYGEITAREFGAFVIEQEE